jgi:5'-phosphate synthase pdxT subunit
MVAYNLMTEVKNLAQNGMPIFGTCAGMILLAGNISDSDVTPLGVMDIVVGRNAFGRQRESFEAELSIPVLGEKLFPAVFIRAPVIKQVNGKAEILARLDDGTAVAARQGKLLVSAFHPELTSDLRFHQYFLDVVSGSS